ncbi:MAG: nicotinamidase [Desulfatiglandales bacterium]|jgi:nicotinamidase/pyrazinamidase|nr:nicotinamidase [Desulfatiglandales bacterium]
MEEQKEKKVEAQKEKKKMNFPSAPVPPVQSTPGQICRMTLATIIGKGNKVERHEKMNHLKRENLRLKTGDALLIVDVQNDFLPGGSLVVPNGDKVIPAFNRYIELVQSKGLPLFATRDWHPKDHCSFKEQGGPWPPHCIVDSEGAQFASELRLPDLAIIISKGEAIDDDNYSCFLRTELDERLRSARIGRLLIGGLATDYCVLHTVKDALKHGYEVLLLEDAIRAVNVHPEDGKKAEEEMTSLGAIPINGEMLG